MTEVRTIRFKGFTVRHMTTLVSAQLVSPQRDALVSITALNPGHPEPCVTVRPFFDVLRADWEFALTDREQADALIEALIEARDVAFPPSGQG